MNIANRLTIARIVMIPLFLLIMCFPKDALGMVSVLHSNLSVSWLLAMIIFTIASITDFLDGYLARKYHLITNFGKFADPLADKLLVMTAFITLVGAGVIPMWIVAVIVCRELAVTGLRLLLVNDGEVLAAAWPGKVKTATQMLAIIFLLIDDFPVKGLAFSIGTILLYVCLVATVYSGVDYFIKNKHVFADSFSV
ncbi:CDP-diacylglycerol--glycerol-3-phosphate 3-phosphatidyltransferase [uncultured Granulicatella sp.]|jgi:CDP-diacylglycerol--glycerol-3-phosphate 3-phosphatidyltransferase|uniref:CDP-diacylglycerol--glycerol-3-phosphate 3-phosphatidyltransferase n=1 Tax=uncultured Granulicatella sp. TaxID=316089 RepID=UPI0028E31303|nr:CDP-diacylglycerol--glycerol-3-phosphate 3-phosphatidyltransferase [uncultured Granulicatella sp.]